MMRRVLFMFLLLSAPFSVWGQTNAVIERMQNDYIKGRKHIAKVHTLREQPKPESVPFNTALKNMQEKAK